MARLADKSPLKMNHTEVCVTVCDCEEPNLVLAVEADLSDVVLEAFFHPTQLYADSMNQGHKQLRVCG